MLPSVNTSKPKYIQPSPYTEISADELPSSTTYSPETRVDDDLIENDVEPVQHRNRTTRLAGLTARFYKHRRSASMSSYDTRTFKRGDQLYASEGKGREERSTFHQKYGNTQTTNIRASVREGAEVYKHIPIYDSASYIYVYVYGISTYSDVYGQYNMEYGSPTGCLN